MAPTLISRIPVSLGYDIFKLSSRTLVPFKISDLLYYGKSPESYPFIAPLVYKELCVRLAHQARRLDSMYSCRPTDQLLAMQLDALNELWKIKHLFKGSTVSTGGGNSGMNVFLRCLRDIEDREATALETLMEGVAAAKLENYTYLQRHGRLPPTDLLTRASVDSLMQNTIGITNLIEHFRACLSPKEKAPGRVGVVAEDYLVHEIVKDQVEHAAYVCERAMNNSPPVVIQGNLEARATFIYSHISHVIFEMLKNALKATLMSKDQKSIIQVRITEGKSEISIMISDKGGGLSRKKLQEYTNYLSSSSTKFDRIKEQQSYQPPSDPLTGTGTGIPVSKLYAKHFGGDLQHFSMEGYGTTVIIYIPKSDCFENIPLRWTC